MGWFPIGKLTLWVFHKPYGGYQPVGGGRYRHFHFPCILQVCIVLCKSTFNSDVLQFYNYDDINKINNAVDILNPDLFSAFQWCQGSGLSLNTWKCKPIIIGTCRLLNNINVNNTHPVTM